MASLPASETRAEEKGVRHILPERPGGCFAQNVPDPFFRSDRVGLESPTYTMPRSSLRLPARSQGQPTVSLTMIVRDEEKNLPSRLGSVAGLFDEIVVVDTGSKDRTPEIAREFGARVFDFVCVDDFAAARNAALARARGDYAFWLDADDVIDPPQRARLEELIKGLEPREQVAHVVKCACDPGPDGAGGDTVVDHIRLFPIREDVRWSFRVHEQILPALKRVNVPVRWTDVTVRHTGYTNRALRARSLVRDCKILCDELAERPDDPFVLFNLGSIAIERQDWRQALDQLRRSLAGSAPTDSITRKLYVLIARSHLMLGKPQQALAALRHGSGRRSGRCRAAVSGSHRPAPYPRQRRRRALLASDLDIEAAGEACERGSRDLRTSHPAQPGGVGQGAR